MLRVPSAHQVCTLMLSLMKWTEPSQKATLTPPGWLLAEVTASIGPPAFLSHEFAATHDHLFGVFQ
jgi:hypothetical protein